MIPLHLSPNPVQPAVLSATISSLRRITRVTPFEPFTLLYRACRGHVRRERNRGHIHGEGLPEQEG
jgi:hypothetical protein